jgi:beta-galactosidase
VPLLEHKRFVLFSILVTVTGAANSAATATALRQTLSLNTGWRFARQDNPGSGVESRFHDAWKPEYDDSEWSQVFVPHTWDKSAHNPWVATNHWRGIGWYRREFDVPRFAMDRKVFLEFEGAFQVTKVWVNGKQVTEHVGGFTGFLADVTSVVRVGGKNVLTVSVDSTNNPDIPPADESNVSVYGGLYRDVWLHIVNPIYIPDGGVTIKTPDVTSQQSTVSVVTEVTNSGTASCKLRLVSSILAREGEVVAKEEVTKEAASGQTVEFEQPRLTVKQPVLWDPDHPNLYTLHSQVYRGGQAFDEISTRFGIRVMGYVPRKGYTINGAFINIHGVDRRQDYGYLGDAVPDAISRRDMQIIKDLGANFIRTAHYVQDKSVLEAADELGILVWEEIPNIKIYDYSPTAARNEDSRYTRKYIDNCLSMIDEMVKRDKNHPSIVIWGIADDMTGYPYLEDLKEMVDRLHVLDPNRWTAGRVYPFLTDVHDPTNSRYFDFKVLAEEHPDWKWLWNEWGAFVNERGVDIWPSKGSGDRIDTGNVDAYSPKAIPSEVTAAIFQEASWIKFEAIPWMATAKWVMFDPGSPATNRTKGIFYFYGPPDKRPWGTRFTGGDYRGLSDMWRIPKASYWFMKAQWTDDPFVYIVSHWTWPGTEGQPREVRVYSTCDEIELFLNGKSLGRRSPASTAELLPEWKSYGLWESWLTLPADAKLRHAPFIWRDVPYEPGVLKAVGIKSGKPYTDEKKTAGEPYQILLKADRERIAAGGRDAVRLVATVADKNGVMVPSANPWLTFRVSGPADLLGTPVLDAVWGMAAINVQSRAEPGALDITASSPGLKGGIYQIISEISKN